VLTRRDFIQSLGIALASLLAARCVPPRSGGQTPRDRLRNCWHRFDELAEQARDVDHFERGQQALDQLVADHRAALDEVVATGELAQDVAAQVQAAFGAAAYHVWRSNAPITCYEPVLIDYRPASSGQLARQLDILVEMAGDGDLDPDVVAQARAAVERDVAFLNLSNDEVAALYNEITSSAQGGVPPFEEIQLEITPQAAQAAQFLVELLLQSSG
jgi:hypothetical protein